MNKTKYTRPAAPPSKGLRRASAQEYLPVSPFNEDELDVDDVAEAVSVAAYSSEQLYDYLLAQRDELGKSLAILDRGKELAKDISKKLKVIDKAIKELAKIDQEGDPVVDKAFSSDYSSEPEQLELDLPPPDEKFKEFQK